MLKRKTKTFLNNPSTLFIKVLYKISPLLPDRLYLKLLFPLKTGYKLNLKKPVTYNEKLQWLKLYYRKAIMTKMVDKYEAKKYTENIIGADYVIQNYGVWDSFEDIDFKKLPNRFILKTTHDQGGVIICRDKSKFDYRNAKKKLTKHLKFKHYYLTREWPYKNVKPRIMAEKLLEDKEKGDLWDYKFYCFNGKPKVMYISMGRQGNNIPLYFFDMEFNQLDIQRPSHFSDNKKIEKPENWELMVELAKQTSKGFPHLRVDFYSIKDEVYSGEYTFFQGGGMMPFIPRSWDYKLGSWIDLNKINQ